MVLAASEDFSKPWVYVHLCCKKTPGFFKGQKSLVADIFCSLVDVKLCDGALDHHDSPRKLEGKGPGASPTARASFSELASLQQNKVRRTWRQPPNLEKEQCCLTTNSADEPAPVLHANV